MSEDDGFLARWSRRKAQVRGGEVPPDKAPRDAPHPVVDRAAAAAPGNTPRADAPQSPVQPAQPAAASPADVQPPDATLPALPSPTLADVAQLTPTSDFSRFVGIGVDESVQHAALKKLFSDPHFNVMDGLDTYIGDYNTPDPMPDGMLRRLVQARAMHLFDVPATGSDVAPVSSESEGTIPAQDSPDGAPGPALSQSTAPFDTASPEPEPDTDEDTALRLQPDDAADAAGAGTHHAGPRT